MKLISIKTILAVVWLLAVSLAGLLGSLSSLSGWVMLAAAAVVPPIVLMWWWNDPPQSMSESIHDARR